MLGSGIIGDDGGSVYEWHHIKVVGLDILWIFPGLWYGVSLDENDLQFI